MADSDKNKDPLEDFFKSYARDYDIEYNEQDWQKLEKRLDLADEKYTYKRRMRWVAAAAMLLFCLLGYFTYENYTAINRLSKQLIGETVPKTEQNMADQELQPSTQDRSDEQEETEGAIVSDPSSQVNESGKAINRPASELTGSDVQVQETQRSSEFSASGQVAEALYISEFSCPECEFVSSEIKNPSVAFSAPESVSSSPNGQNMIAKAAGFRSYSAGNENVNMGRKKSPGITAGLVLGPDLSTVGSISNFQNPGYKMGLSVELSLGSHLAVSTGIIYSNVRYVARGGEYNPGGYWNHGVVAQETFAECALLDVPISLKYDFLQFDRSRLYATAGLSSYVMLSEDYRFRYNSENPDLIHRWSGNTGTRHWFSNASFSLGYELDVHPAWSIRVEPFVKLPLKEVGWGNVKLYSVGTFISLNYKLSNL